MLKISTKQLLILVTIVFILFLAYYNQAIEENEVLNSASNFTLEVKNEAAEKANRVEIKNDNQEIIVHLSGEVKNPGVYKLKSKERLIDLIKAAGGLKNKADLEQINLAEKIFDGQKVVIPSVLDRNSNQAADHNFIESGNFNVEGKLVSSYSKSAEKELVNINLAGQDLLESLSGIGPAKAKAIIKYRNQNSFNKKEDLLNISGIGKKTLENLENEITVK
ncbi:competence protein ComEA [Halanaerobium congolense]|uniref:Competence protein ComEA n=1 Tax=Halanaerobium congolense TaxID=54121 RepID=A0A318E589_9FIRM|nr:helix-hairpin-helix domain-containing protein [Halanaerobium congolense]PXV66426.1 competence protein ComEA [Halanaerobium congolense]